VCSVKESLLDALRDNELNFSYMSIKIEKVFPCLLLLVCLMILPGCAGYVSQAQQQQNVRMYVDSHPELSDEQRNAILNGKLCIGLPFEAVQLMTSGGLTGGMVKKDEIVSENGTLQVWFNGWYDMYFRNDRLVMWRAASE
jgi:hypothetical protein